MGFNLSNGFTDSRENTNLLYMVQQVPYVVDNTAPTVSTVALTSATGIQNSRLNEGDVVTATVNFSEAVTVTGTPQLALNVGGTMVQANYAAGSGTNALTFTYTILAGQTDANGISIGASSLALNGGAIRDRAGNNATLTHTLVADNTSYLVDTTAPTATLSTGTTPNTASASVQSTEVGTAYLVKTGGTGAVAVSNLASITGAADAKQNSVAIATANTATSLSLAGLEDGTYTLYTVDQAGNLSGASSASYTVDSTAPTLEITDNTSGTASGAVTYTFTFSEDVGTSFTASDITVTGGTLGTLTKKTDTTYEMVVRPSVGSGTLVVDVTTGSYSDLAGNANTADTIANSQAYADVQQSATISMGTWGGQLIHPVQVEGKWYYVWDVDGDGAHRGGGSDDVSMDSLETMFFGNSTGTVMTDTNRTMTLENGVTIMLPTRGDGQTDLAVIKPGTSVSSPEQNNPTYDDLLAIWDAHNGAGTGTVRETVFIGPTVNGIPAWRPGRYWSSTPGQEWGGIGHNYVDFGDGFVYGQDDIWGEYVAFQVL